MIGLQLGLSVIQPLNIIAVSTRRWINLPKKRVRSYDFIPYEINDWSSVDFALYYQREEDKKYNLSVEHGNDQTKMLV